jgi:signal transduction histidine kinase
MIEPVAARWGPREWLFLFAAGLGLWLLVGLVDIVWYVLVISTKSAPPSIGAVLRFNLPYWMVAALLTPAVVWVARHVRFTPGRRWRAAGIHILCAIPFSALHEIAFRAVSFPLIGKQMSTADFVGSIPKFLAGTLDKGLLFYAVIVGAYTIGETYQRNRERERAAAAMELERAQLKASLAEARLGALKAQIQPHFLFNALHAVSTLVLKGESQAADRMLSHLSRFLRMTLDRGDSSVVPLAVELEFLDAYLRIQQERFGDRLRVEKDIPRDALDAEVPNLILQPLVENSIHHGIAADPGAGRIRVRCAIADGRLTLEVEDDGVGMGEGPPPEERVGLGNIRARLAHLYAEGQTFTLRPAMGRGTIATIVIPHRRAAAADVRRSDGADPNAHRG